MFEESIASGEALLRRLEFDTMHSNERLPLMQPSEVVSFNELESWRDSTARLVGQTLGSDPLSRFEYLWQLFADEWQRARGPSSAGLDTLRGLVRYLGRLEDRLKSASANRTFDWNVPPDPNGPHPELQEIEAKRWEFFRALVEDGERKSLGTVDPIATAGRLALHPIHAREFFISLAGSGHLNRQWLTPEWREFAKYIDSEGQTGSPDSALRETERVPLSVFLCHAKEDKAAVRTLRSMIEKWGHDPWLDEEKLLPGQDWDLEIRRAVERADVVIVCLSERSEKRGYVQKEIKRALDIADEYPEGSIFLIPVKLTDCSVPDRLKKWQWVDLHIGGGPSKLEAALQLRATEKAMRR
jgi:hypothetical protein